MTSVIVVGAGVGGLTAAIALDRAGVDVTVIDPAPHADALALGSGIHLWSNALQAFDRIGLAGEIAAAGNPIDTHRYLRVDESAMGVFDVGSASDDHGAPTVGLSRPVLHRHLVEALGVDRIRFGCAAGAVEQDAASATVTLSDGSRISGDAVIGADGISSTVRAAVTGSRPLHYSGLTSWRGLCGYGHPALEKQSMQIYWGRGARMVMYQVSGGLLYWLALVKAPPRGSDPIGGAREAARSHFAGWPEFVQGAIDATEEAIVHRADIVRMSPSRRWGRGRITTLGDAIHAMSPDVAQGACQAIEDGVALGIAVGAERDLTDGLRRYENVRRSRAAGMMRMSTVVNRLGGLDGAVAVSARDRLLLPFFYNRQAATKAKGFLTPALDR